MTLYEIIIFLKIVFIVIAVATSRCQNAQFKILGIVPTLYTTSRWSDLMHVRLRGMELAQDHVQWQIFVLVVMNCNLPNSQESRSH
jgi:hypothetical protein